MYVCVCNALTEDDVLGCVAEGGCRNTREVKAACGWKPGCGSCTKRLARLVSEYRTASDLVDAITGGPALPRAVPEPPAEPAPEPVRVFAPARSRWLTSDDLADAESTDRERSSAESTAA
ncbi:(2Fe-2S)-binding protein [Actinomadura kijaniata]|uniref:(2Fe-2S)-binding protein n=1 Tax=Actinomadura kijaniata TaxID=46161 RepID=UPI000832F68C|nr:(2Fe-2S)-binding protein [Actinomadura kijaniata]